MRSPGIGDGTTCPALHVWAIKKTRRPSNNDGQNVPRLLLRQHTSWMRSPLSCFHSLVTTVAFSLEISTKLMNPLDKRAGDFHVAVGNRLDKFVQSKLANLFVGVKSWKRWKWQ
jgi:hypothetical protein